MPATDTNGIVTFYEDTGDGPMVVLIHGHSLDLRMWKYQVAPLVDMGYRVVRYDVRGHGRSESPPSGYTWDNYSQDLAELLDHLDPPVAGVTGVQGAHVVGLSMGGGIALKFTLDHPERVLSLALVDSTLPGFVYSEEFISWVLQLREAVRAEGPRGPLERLWLAHPLFGGLRRHPQRFAEVEEMVAGFQAAEYLADPDPSYVQPDIASRLAEVTVPSLVVVGEDDIPDFRLIASVLTENLPDSRNVIMPRLGHITPLEDPEVFNGVLLEFLASLPRPERSAP
jgi:pimeloyl-ACP methyl ester carboxylesterase